MAQALAEVNQGTQETAAIASNDGQDETVKTQGQAQSEEILDYKFDPTGATSKSVFKCMDSA